jgi:hypothetical protein
MVDFASVSTIESVTVMYGVDSCEVACGGLLVRVLIQPRTKYRKKLYEAVQTGSYPAQHHRCYRPEAYGSIGKKAASMNRPNREAVVSGTGKRHHDLS